MPFQVPALAVRVWRSLAVPVMPGGAVFLGASGATTAVGTLTAVAVPSGLVAVTDRRMVEPTSAEESL